MAISSKVKAFLDVGFGLLYPKPKPPNSFVKIAATYGTIVSCGETVFDVKHFQVQLPKVPTNDEEIQLVGDLEKLIPKDDNDSFVGMFFEDDDGYEYYRDDETDELHKYPSDE